MSFSGDSSDAEWKATKVKTEKIIKRDRKCYQQRFVERWLERFKPWLARDTDDPEKPFCKACNCRLNCNKCHLQRHERTTKHHSNLQTYLNQKGLLPFKQNIGQRKEKKKNIKSSDVEADDSKFESVYMDVVGYEGKKEKPDDDMNSQEVEDDYQLDQSEMNVEEPQSSQSTPQHYDVKKVHSTTKRIEKSPQSKGPIKKDRKKLLLQIQQDKNELMASFNELFTSSPVVERKEKNHVDLFFESVSSSVKALTPKLIAETKMRVSQLICELELRAITENESNNTSHASSSSTVLLAVPPGMPYIINHGQNGNNQVGSSQNDHAYETIE